MDYRVEVKVNLKKGVLDAEGETVKKSLDLLGFKVENVETVKNYVLTVEGASEEEAVEVVRGACEKLLANPVIQEYQVKVL